jgi:hypothetical protein
MVYTIATDIDQLIRDYEFTKSGYFFSKETVNAFGTKYTNLYKKLSDGVAVFATTENKNGERLYCLYVVTTCKDDSGFIKFNIHSLKDYMGLNRYNAYKIFNTLTLSDVGA